MTKKHTSAKKVQQSAFIGLIRVVWGAPVRNLQNSDSDSGCSGSGSGSGSGSRNLQNSDSDSRAQAQAQESSELRLRLGLKIRLRIRLRFRIFKEFVSKICVFDCSSYHGERPASEKAYNLQVWCVGGWVCVCVHTHINNIV